MAVAVTVSPQNGSVPAHFSEVACWAAAAEADISRAKAAALIDFMSPRSFLFSA
jgi:hypothetical protein